MKNVSSSFNERRGNPKDCLLRSDRYILTYVQSRIYRRILPFFPNQTIWVNSYMISYKAQTIFSFGREGEWLEFYIEVDFFSHKGVNNSFSATVDIKIIIWKYTFLSNWKYILFQCPWLSKLKKKWQNFKYSFLFLFL